MLCWGRCGLEHMWHFSIQFGVSSILYWTSKGMSRERACPLMIQGLVQILSFTMSMWPHCCTKYPQTHESPLPGKDNAPRDGLSQEFWMACPESGLVLWSFKGLSKYLLQCRCGLSTLQSAIQWTRTSMCELPIISIMAYHPKCKNVDRVLENWWV